jgi:quercetin dioxygenase-like cupin family protein
MHPADRLAQRESCVAARCDSPEGATLQVLHGLVRLTSPDTSWDGRPGDHLVIPSTRHGLHAVDDSGVLLTVAKSVQR